MGKTLNEIAQQLRGVDKKVQLIYAFNGTGKTRLSRQFKQEIVPKVLLSVSLSFPISHPQRNGNLYFQLVHRFGELMVR